MGERLVDDTLAPSRRGQGDTPGSPASEPTDPVDGTGPGWRSPRSHRLPANRRGDRQRVGAGNSDERWTVHLIQWSGSASQPGRRRSGAFLLSGEHRPSGRSHTPSDAPSRRDDPGQSGLAVPAQPEDHRYEEQSEVVPADLQREGQRHTIASMDSNSRAGSASSATPAASAWERRGRRATFSQFALLLDSGSLTL
jgi:hypothetical protein